MADDDLDPLELEHMMGFKAEHKSSVQYHPTDPDVMISYNGCLVVIGNVNDPHKQEFLRGHEEEITALALSPSGNLIASGQISSTRVPNSEAQVIVWDYKSRQPIYKLIELHDGIAFSRNRVLQLAFSRDERFLAGCDDQTGGAKLCLWDMESGQLANITKTKSTKTFSFLCWGVIVASQRKLNRHPTYKLFGGSDSRVDAFKLDFDVHTMQYKLESTPMQMPSSGLVRRYFCAAMIGDQFLVAGSSAGELCVFNVDTGVFRACVPVSCGGLLSIVANPPQPGKPQLVYCGCGDGKLKVVQGADLEWILDGETTLSGMVTSLTLNATGQEVLAATSEGNIYRMDSSLKVLTPGGGAMMASHTKPVTCLTFGETSEMFSTGAENGSVRLWELSHYSVVTEVFPDVKMSATTSVQPTCLQMISAGGDAQDIISGWNDGFIRGHADSGQLLWEIASAHRGGVSCISLGPTYIVSGGADGSLRLWTRDSHTHIAQFAEHKGKVAAVLADLHQPHLIHSCGEDKTVVTVDLRQERRVMCHATKEGKFSAMTQSTVGELELITSDTAGSIKVWDCDELEPVSMLVTWHPADVDINKRLNHVALSPAADGRPGSDYLLVSTASGAVQVWDLDQPAAPVSEGIAHSDEVLQAQWSPDAKQVVSVGLDGCICVWNFFGTKR